MKIATETHLRQLLAVISLRSPFGARDQALIRLGYATGLRVGELVSLNVGQVWAHGRAGSWLELPGSNCKGGRGRPVPLSAAARQAVAELVGFLGQRGFSTSAEAPLLTDRRHRRLAAREVQRLMQRYREAAGLELRITPHTLRHSFASRLVAEGTSLRVVQQLLGHHALGSTEVYLHTQPGELAAAVERPGLG